MEETNVDADRATDTDAGGDGSGNVSRSMILGGSIAGSGVVITGVVVYVLERVGPPGAEEAVWILGYGLTIFVLWYLFVRPIDFRGE